MANYRFNRNQYRIDWLRRHHRYEQSMYKVFKLALDDQVKQVSEWIKANGVNIEPMLSVLVSPQPISEAYRICYSTIGTQEAKYVYTFIKRLGERKEIPSFFSEYWRKMMVLFFETEAGERITGVTETTRESITKLLADSVGMSLSEQATYILEHLDSPDFNRYRALMIARTESTAAAGQGAYLANQSSDYETVKEWISVMDKNTRHTHMVADGQVVESYDMFEVGAELALYPGALTLSAAESIQCRCTYAFVPKTDGDGLPILK